MRVLASAVIAFLVGAAAPTAHAAWQDTAGVPAAEIRTASVTPPQVECQPVSGPVLRFEWDPLPGATHYILRYGLTGAIQPEVVDASVTHKDIYVLGLGSITVQARYGSDAWVSSESNAKSYTVVALVGICL